MHQSAAAQLVLIQAGGKAGVREAKESGHSELTYLRRQGFKTIAVEMKFSKTRKSSDFWREYD